MAAVVVTTAHPSPLARPVPGDRARPDRPSLELIEGGRRAARAYARAHPRSRPLPAAVYRRRRITALLVVALVGLVVALAVVGAGALLARPSVGAPAAPAAVSGTTAAAYVVQPGDTLWSIARSLHPHGDLRPVVDRLEARAGGATLVPGERIRLDGIGG